MQLDLDRSIGGRLDEGSGGQTSGHQLQSNARLAIQDLAKKVAYHNDPDQVDWSYTQGTELVELGDYYERYVKGGFTDERGHCSTQEWTSLQV